MKHSERVGKCVKQGQEAHKSTIKIIAEPTG